MCAGSGEPRQAPVPCQLAGHLQSQLWSPAAVSGLCREGLAGGHRRPLSGPQVSAVAGAECCRTSGPHLGYRMVAGETRGEKLEGHPCTSGSQGVLGQVASLGRLSQTPVWDSGSQGQALQTSCTLERVVPTTTRLKDPAAGPPSHLSSFSECHNFVLSNHPERLAFFPGFQVREGSQAQDST